IATRRSIYASPTGRSNQPLCRGRAFLKKRLPSLATILACIRLPRSSPASSRTPLVNSTPKLSADGAGCTSPRGGGRRFKRLLSPLYRTLNILAVYIVPQPGRCLEIPLVARLRERSCPLRPPRPKIISSGRGLVTLPSKQLP